MRKISTCSIPLHFWTQSSLDIFAGFEPLFETLSPIHCDVGGDFERVALFTSR